MEFLFSNTARVYKIELHRFSILIVLYELKMDNSPVLSLNITLAGVQQINKNFHARFEFKN